VTFGAPLLLWSLAALVPLAAIYLLKVRPRRRPTTALFLWRQIVQERRPHHLLHRLRDLWSLLLMALAFAAVALALAEPRWRDADRQDLLVLIDTSASMQASDGAATRLGRAQDRARDIARAMDGVERVAVASIDRDLRFLSHLTDNSREILAAVDRAECTNHELNLRALPREPEKGEQVKRTRVLLVSDGGFAATALPPHVELVRVGEPRDNIGIVAADLDFVPGQVDQLRFFFQVASSGKEPRSVDLLLSSVEGDVDQLKKVIPLSVKPGANEPQVLTIGGAKAGHWVAKLEHSDALATDDTVYLVARRPPPIEIAVAAESRFFLEQSVLAFARDGNMLRLVADTPHVVLAQGTGPEAERVIVVGPGGDSPWWESLGEEIDVSAPRILVEDHPALRHIDPATIQFVGARHIKPPPGTQVLVDTPEGEPLVYVTSRSGKTAVVVNLDPVAAEFYFSAWFPVLVHSAATHLVGREEPLRAVYAPQATVPMPFNEEETGQLIAPSGARHVVRGKRFAEFSELGFYQLEAGRTRDSISCSLLSTEESLLARSDESPDLTSLPSGVAPAYWLTVAAIVVLTTESILYHRRKVG
jgi:hypothetical protein